EAREAPKPRRGSIRAAIEGFRRDGIEADALAKLLAQAEVRLVLTAHPTEARRRTTIEKLARVFGVLRDLDERPAVTADDARRRPAPAVQDLWASRDFRAASAAVYHDVGVNLVWLLTSRAAIIPDLYRDSDAALADAYPALEVVLPPLLTFLSCIGGDLGRHV